MRVKVIEWIISFQHATRMIKKLNVKKNNPYEFSYELTELKIHPRYFAYSEVPASASYKRNTYSNVAGSPRMYSEYQLSRASRASLFHLKVFREDRKT